MKVNGYFFFTVLEFEAINRLLTWADFRNCNIFVRKINCVVATNGGPWSEDLRWIKNGGVKEIVNEQIIQTMKFEIPNGGCTPLATRKPHRTTKHAIEKQTEWAQAAFIYCNDTKKYPMAQKKNETKIFVQHLHKLSLSRKWS